ncbi:MAG: iron-containing alcohol dehydrogenase [Candidatus Heteroscillospira sp.]|jgi:alcohol dehydrogenase class IV
MNSIKKLWCRTFQTGLRLALPLLPYRSPRVLDSIDALPNLLREKNISRVLLVTDRGIRSHGITLPLERLLQRSGIACSVFDGTVANPTTENVENARQLYLLENCQAIIGLGGGSSIDCAKAVGARIARPRKSLEKMGGILKVNLPLPLLIAIPTTAGTGSETTLAAVITDSVTRHKYPINDFPLIPRVAVLDPALTRSLPPFITATTGMDALTHATEAYIGRSTTASTRRDALESVALIFRSLDAAVEDGGDMDARRDMLRAAFLAGRAFSKSYVGYVHAMAHALGGRYNTPHGLANAILLPDVLESYGGAVHNKLKNLAVAAGLADSSTPDSEAAAAYIAALRGMKKRYGVPDTVSALRREDIPQLARWAEREANPLYPVPVLWGTEELEDMYKSVLEEENHGENSDRSSGAEPERVFPQRRDAAC